METQLNQLALNFAPPVKTIVQPVSALRAAIENSMGEARLLCEQWAKTNEAGTLDALRVTWEFVELRMKHSQSRSDVLAEYALLRSIVADRYHALKKVLYPARPRYINPNDPAETWSGRGRKPEWLEEWLRLGATMESMEIPASNGLRS